MAKKLNLEIFIEKAKNIHGDRYDYSNVNYITSKINVNISCSKHGIFNQAPSDHIKGRGCIKCSNERKSCTTEEFIKKAITIHGNTYGYKKVNYIRNSTKVTITCKKHGDFEQIPNNHLHGSDCYKCGIDKIVDNKSYSENAFIDKASNIHKNFYTYKKIKYVESKEKIVITCPKHGDFEQAPDKHLQGQGCKKCANIISKPELELQEFLSQYVEIKTNNRKILNGKELDIYIPSKNLAIEYNGLYFHSEKFKDKNFHINKTNDCILKKIQLIHIFEDEWLFKKEVVKSRLLNILGKTENKIYARKTTIKEVSPKDSMKFLNDNHLQGNCNSSVRLGLYYNEELVSVILFNKPRLGIGGKYDGYELSRFSSKLNTSVIGGADKLLKYFIRTYSPKKIISYADIRWSDGGLYNKLGFTETHRNKPNYSYINGQTRKHRFNYRKQKLKDEGFDITNKTEHEIMLERQIYRVYDCGTISYTMNLST